MNAKEEAKEIFFGFMNLGRGYTSSFLAKVSAELCIEKMLETCENKRRPHLLKIKEEIKKLN